MVCGLYAKTHLAANQTLSRVSSQLCLEASPRRLHQYWYYKISLF